jgi:phosphorylase kinase alpha/beta subunit
LFSASPSQTLDSLTGYQNVRVRDNVMVANAFLQPNCEVQWCIFDPLLSTIYGQRFLADPTDKGSFTRQMHYVNRSLAQVTADGQCPELYFLKQERYVPNATPRWRGRRQTRRSLFIW